MQFADWSPTVGTLASCNILAVIPEHIRQIGDGNNLAAGHVSTADSLPHECINDHRLHFQIG